MQRQDVRTNEDGETAEEDCGGEEAAADERGRYASGYDGRVRPTTAEDGTGSYGAVCRKQGVRHASSV